MIISGNFSTIMTCVIAHWSEMYTDWLIIIVNAVMCLMYCIISIYMVETLWHYRYLVYLRSVIELLLALSPSSPRIVLLWELVKCVQFWSCSRWLSRCGLCWTQSYKRCLKSATLVYSSFFSSTSLQLSESNCLAESVRILFSLCFHLICTENVRHC